MYRYSELRVTLELDDELCKDANCQLATIGVSILVLILDARLIRSSRSLTSTCSTPIPSELFCDAWLAFINVTSNKAICQDRSIEDRIGITMVSILHEDTMLNCIRFPDSKFPWLGNPSPNYAFRVKNVLLILCMVHVTSILKSH